MNLPRVDRQYFTPHGTLTPEGFAFFRDLVLAVQDLQRRVEALEP